MHRVYNPLNALYRRGAKTSVVRKIHRVERLEQTLEGLQGELKVWSTFDLTGLQNLDGRVVNLEQSIVRCIKADRCDQALLRKRLEIRFGDLNEISKANLTLQVQCMKISVHKKS